MNSEVKKVVIIQNKIMHYRVSFYNELAKHCRLTIVHSGNSLDLIHKQFDEKIVALKKIGPFYYQFGLSDVIKGLSPNYIVAMFDVRWISSLVFSFLSDYKVKWIWWGLDEGKSRLALLLKVLISIRNIPIIFYSAKSLKKFVSYGINPNKLFVANNTYHVPGRIVSYEYSKDIFINVGSLDPRKDNISSIAAFKRAIEKTGSKYKYVLIGDGSDKERIIDYIRQESLEDLVILHSEITDPNILAEFYKRAVASVSFGQAGLAVLQSMAFGVPFVTKVNAISGGEISNIKNNENGILCEDRIESLESSLIQLIENPSWAKNLGKSAYDYYSSYCNVKNMANGFLLAFNYRNKK